jgi:hypothetical protein
MCAVFENDIQGIVFSWNEFEPVLRIFIKTISLIHEILQRVTRHQGDPGIGYIDRRRFRHRSAKYDHCRLTGDEQTRGVHFGDSFRIAENRIEGAREKTHPENTKNATKDNRFGII